MKRTNNQLFLVRVASKTPFAFGAHALVVVFCLTLSAPFASALRRLPRRQDHRKAKSSRDRWRLILKQRTGTLLKAESPMDFTPFIQTRRFVINFGTRESTHMCSIGLAKRICTVSSIGRASDS